MLRNSNENMKRVFLEGGMHLKENQNAQGNM